MKCTTQELRSLFLFEHLTDEQLDWLCEHGSVEEFEPGFVYREGEPATCFYVLLDGELILYRKAGGQDDIEILRTSNRGVYAGAWHAYLGERASQHYDHSVRLLVPSRFFVLDADRLTELMSSWFPMALHLLEGVFLGSQNMNRLVGQRERLLALGSLSAGLTHELNNPAAAAVRATAALRERVAGMRHKLGLIAAGPFDRIALETLIRLQEDAVEHVGKAPQLSPMEAADREDAIGDWLEEHGVPGGWQIAPIFVAGGLDTGWLDRAAITVAEATGDGGSILEGAIRWLNYTVETELLMHEIEDSTNRISNLVGAAKQYSQMDRAPYQTVDVHELLDSTLVMLTGKIGPDVTVVRDYDRTLPAVPVYAAELNQVWTNLIDNAVAAMEGEGTLTVRTRGDGDRILVEICDTGPGVPEDIRGRIFEPFFTTKGVGEGTGLGLDISWRIVVNRHHGDLSVESVPGNTRFVVCLPLRPEAD